MRIVGNLATICESQIIHAHWSLKTEQKKEWQIPIILSSMDIILKCQYFKILLIF